MTTPNVSRAQTVQVTSIAVKGGLLALVDVPDAPKLIGLRWYPVRGKYTTYAKAAKQAGDDPGPAAYMHRLILGLGPGEYTDHINGNGLDNRRANLRVCSVQENNCNSRKRRDCTSPYKGVHWHQGTGKWRAMIKIEGKQRHLGLFEDQIKAAKAYDQAAAEAFGQFARLNFPPK